MYEVIARIWRSIAATDIWPLTTTAQKVRLLISVIPINLLDTFAKLLGPLSMAKAVAMLAKNEKELIFAGITLSTENLIYISAMLNLVSYCMPRARKLILYGIEEEIGKKLSARLIYRSFELVKELPKNQLSKNLFLPLNKNLYLVNNLVPRLFANSLENIQPLMFDTILGSTLTYSRFGSLVGTTIVIYILLALIINEFISWLTNQARRTEITKTQFSKFIRQWQEVLQNSETVTLFDRSQFELQNAMINYNDYHAMQKGNSLRERLSSLQVILIGIIQIICAFYVTRDLSHFDISDIVFLLSYVANIARCIDTINGSFRAANETIADLDGVYKFIGDEKRTFPKSSNTFTYRTDRSNTIFNANEQAPLLPVVVSPAAMINHFSYKPIREYAIKFNNVSLCYERNRPILESLNFEISKGKVTAIVGSSNVGKTTITRLICGLIKPSNENSSIEIFGTLLNDIPDNILRQTIGIVRQQNELFKDDSVAYNVSYAFVHDQHLNAMRNPDTNIEIRDSDQMRLRLQQVADQANIRKIIDRCPVNELSGGENQRIGIARALSRNSEIFIFDEPTSQLDYETEHKVLTEIYEKTRGKTVLIIAHRLSTIMDADNIIVLGRPSESSGATVIERGTHDQLLQKEGAYEHLWKLQTTGKRMLL